MLTLRSSGTHRLGIKVSVHLSDWENPVKSNDQIQNHAKTLKMIVIITNHLVKFKNIL